MCSAESHVGRQESARARFISTGLARVGRVRGRHAEVCGCATLHSAVRAAQIVYNASVVCEIV